MNAVIGAPGTAITMVVPAEISDVRLDVYLTQQLPQYSRNFFQRLIKDGLIELNDTIVVRSSQPVKSFDRICIKFPQKLIMQPEEVVERVKEANLAIDVVAEHEHFLIIDKPAGLLVHAPSDRSTAVTLVDWLLLNYPDLATVGYNERPGIVHRLDKDTSGLLVVPRTAYAHAAFSKLFKDRAIQKLYHAVVEGHPALYGSIDMAIGRGPSGIKMATFPAIYADPSMNTGMLRRPRARHAITHFRVLRYFDAHSLVEARLVTGRTHQIRVHFAGIGHPIVGDPVYGKKSKFIKRQALHAYSLSFMFDGKSYTFTKEVPSDFQQLLTHLKPHAYAKHMPNLIHR